LLYRTTKMISSNTVIGVVVDKLHVDSVAVDCVIIHVGPTARYIEHP